MRNYVAMKVLWVHATRPPGPANDQEFVAWGADDDQLREFMTPAINIYIATYPNATLRYNGPFTVWWELNKENIAKLLNGPPDISTKIPFSAVQYWGNTIALRWGQTTWPISPGDFFYSMTDIEKSPRSSWSHGH